jgi:ATP-binding cassette subfamily B protein
MATETSRSRERAPVPPFGPGRGGPPSFGATGARARDSRATLRRLWGYLRGQWAVLSLAALVVIAMSGLNLLGPWLLGRAVDRYIRRNDLRGLFLISLAMLAVYLLSALLLWIQGTVMAIAAQRAVRHIRADLFAALQRLPLRFFDTRSHGDLMSRLTNDVESLSQVLTDSVPNIVFGLLTLVGTAVVMFLLSPPLALASIVVTTMLTAGLGRWAAGRTRAAFRAQQAALGALNGTIEETVGGQRVVKAYGREAHALDHFETMNRAMREAGTRAQMMAGMMGPFMNGVNNMSLAVVAGVGGWLALRGAVTVGTIAAFMSYARQYARPLSDIANLYNAIQGALAGAERAFEIIDEPPDVDATDSKTLDGALRGEVEFDHVTFGYDPEKPVLRDVSLRARPGETVALIGPTGAGKTTIVNLLSRFYEVDSGSIRLDGTDIRLYRKEDLRRQLAAVLQDSFLFALSVRENIRYGRLDATDEEVEAAARLANAHAFIHRLPHGYDTMLTERGENLSQGQRQLLAIARAILANPRILILDEATSNVDTRTEKHIQEAMRRLMAGRTSFVIAHRLSTIRSVDHILVIEHGRIIESGTHRDLLARRGFYYRLSTGRFGEVHDEDPSETGAKSVVATGQ